MVGAGVVKYFEVSEELSSVETWILKPRGICLSGVSEELSSVETKNGEH